MSMSNTSIGRAPGDIAGMTDEELEEMRIRAGAAGGAQGITQSAEASDEQRLRGTQGILDDMISRVSGNGVSPSKPAGPYAGKPRFMSNEQWDGVKQRDAAALGQGPKIPEGYVRNPEAAGILNDMSSYTAKPGMATKGGAGIQPSAAQEEPYASHSNESGTARPANKNDAPAADLVEMAPGVFVTPKYLEDKKKAAGGRYTEQDFKNANPKDHASMRGRNHELDEQEKNEGIRHPGLYQGPDRSKMLAKGKGKGGSRKVDESLERFRTEIDKAGRVKDGELKKLSYDQRYRKEHLRDYSLEIKKTFDALFQEDFTKEETATLYRVGKVWASQTTDTKRRIAFEAVEKIAEKKAQDLKNAKDKASIASVEGKVGEIISKALPNEWKGHAAGAAKGDPTSLEWMAKNGTKTLDAIEAMNASDDIGNDRSRAQLASQAQAISEGFKDQAKAIEKQRDETTKAGSADYRTLTNKAEGLRALAADYSRRGLEFADPKTTAKKGIISPKKIGDFGFDPDFDPALTPDKEEGSDAIRALKKVKEAKAKLAAKETREKGVESKRVATAKRAKSMSKDEKSAFRAWQKEKKMSPVSTKPYSRYARIMKSRKEAFIRELEVEPVKETTGIVSGKK